MAWKDLNMNEKAAFISIAVQNGLLDREQIETAYNRFDIGGKKDNSSWLGRRVLHNMPAREWTPTDFKYNPEDGTVEINSFGHKSISGMGDVFSYLIKGNKAGDINYEKFNSNGK